MNTVDQVMALRSEVLARSSALREVRAASGSASASSGPDGNGAAPVGGFADTLTQALRKVSAVQKHSADMQVGFERGEVTDIAQVMIARQEAGVAFEATLQVRNKLLSSYQEIMRMGG